MQCQTPLSSVSRIVFIMHRLEKFVMLAHTLIENTKSITSLDQLVKRLIYILAKGDVRAKVELAANPTRTQFDP